MTIIDISLSLSPNLPVWPGSQKFQLSWSKQLQNGDACNNSHISCDSHTGTHLDAPSHYIKNGVTIDNLSLDRLIGPCSVIYLPDIEQITPMDLAAANLDTATSRLLIRTDNSKLWAAGETEFKKKFCALTPDAARWLVHQKMSLVGIDYLSVGTYQGGDMTHQLLLGSGVIVLEGLNLSDVSAGKYELICLPLDIKGAEGAPARAVLRKS